MIGKHPLISLVIGAALIALVGIALGLVVAPWCSFVTIPFSAAWGWHVAGKREMES